MRGTTVVPRPSKRRSLQTAKLATTPSRGRRPQRQASASVPEKQAFRMRTGAHCPLPPRRRRPQSPNPGPAPARRPISALRPSPRALLEGGLGSVRMRVAGAGAGAAGAGWQQRSWRRWPQCPGASCAAGLGRAGG